MTSKTVTRLQKIKARTDVGHDGRDIAWLINEVERLTDIVKRLAGPMKRAGYDCPHCHAQIVFGDSICPMTKEQHAEPTRDETTGGVDAFTWELAKKQLDRLVGLEEELARWKAACTGKHGSQAPCVPPVEPTLPQAWPNEIARAGFNELGLVSTKSGAEKACAHHFVALSSGWLCTNCRITVAHLPSENGS